MVDRALTWFIYAWCGFAAVCAFAKIIEAALLASTWYGSIGAAVTTLWDMFDPFNIKHFVAELIFLSPALGAFWWREKRKERRWARYKASAT